MSRDLSRQALRVFEAAIDLSSDEIDRFLNESCGDNDQLRREVESLLAASEEASDLLPEGRSNNLLSCGATEKKQQMETAGTFAVGSILAGRYEVIELIGVGGMGEVYRAIDRRLHREVAIKSLCRGGSSDRQLRQRFERELRVVASLSNPNIVTLYDVTDHDELTLAVMELAEGQTLAQRMQSRMSSKEALQLTRDVALGLAAAHDRNVMHRDIKPENVMVTFDGRAKVLDFGLARSESINIDQAITIGIQLAGTIPYMSPEQAESQTLSCATDVFSLGVVLYEMLSGTHPFRTDSPLETLRRVADAHPAPLEDVVADVPESVSSLVHKMLARSPHRRPTARQVAEQIEILGDKSTVVASSRTTSHGSSKGAADNWQPSLMILPFQVLGDEVEIENISLGLTANLATVLTRVPMLRLTSRSASFALSERSPTAEDSRRRFAVDYIIEGSLQRIGDGLQANVQLIETRRGFCLWAQQFDWDNDETAIPSLLREILPRLESQLNRAIFNDVRDAQGERTGRHLLIQAMTLLNLKGWHRDSFVQVAELLREAISIEPELALAHAHLSLIRGLGSRIGLVDDPETAVRETLDHAEAALELDNMDSNVLGIAGCALADIGETRRGIPMLKMSLELNPNNAQAHAGLGAAYLADEDFGSAIDHLRRGIELSPLDARLAVWNAFLAVCHLLNEDPTAAHEAAQSACQSDRKSYIAHVVLTAVQVVLGQSDVALSTLAESLRIKPDLTQDEITKVVGRRLGLALKRLRRQYEASNQSQS